MNLEEHKKKYFESIKPVAGELRNAGFEIKKVDFKFLKSKSGVILDMEKDMGMSVEENDLQYLGQKYKPLPKQIVDILLKWIPKVKYSLVKKVLVIQLASTKIKYSGKVLADLFEQDQFDDLRWQIANTLALTKAEGIQDWLLKTAQNPKYDKDREMLMIAIGKLVNPEKANPILIKMFSEFTGHAAVGLSHSGGKKELEFLQREKLKADYKPWERREIEKAIKKIEKRLERLQK